eukprot:m.187797 g.187797  ORF g.187797 m.187797 type:complete len:53 (+) comp24806_c0_seq1:106-264(+)
MGIGWARRWSTRPNMESPLNSEKEGAAYPSKTPCTGQYITVHICPRISQRCY